MQVSDLDSIASNNYDTNINVIGSIKDCNVIFKTIEAYFNESDSVNDLIISRNELNLRTEKSRLRITHAINSSFLFFLDNNHKNFLKKVFLNISMIEAKYLVLFWQFAIVNRLFFDITSNVFIKTYFSGRATLPKDDITAYIKDSIKNNLFGNVNWSENTINIISTKYLNFMTKIGLLEGNRNKTFKYINLSSQSFILFLYFSKIYEPNCLNLLDNNFLPFSFVSKDKIIEKVKYLAQKGMVSMSFNGVVLKVELNVDYKGDFECLI